MGKKEEFTADLKNIYNALTKETAEMELDNLEQKWVGNIHMRYARGEIIGKN